MIRGFLSMFRPGYAKTLVYMLQSTEYSIAAYLSWYWRTTDFGSVAIRRQLDSTRRASALGLALRSGMVLQLLLGVTLFVAGVTQSSRNLIVCGLLLALSYPLVWAHLILLPLLIAKKVIVEPKDKRAVAASRKVFASTKAVKIAVAGSYGKTTMKELLLTVLSQGKKVAATPANRNVATSHAVFASSLKGDEEVVIIEFGEGRPGDVAAFTQTTQPNIGIITGLAPAHLDAYKTMQAAGEDIFSLAASLDEDAVFVNGESDEAKPYTKAGYHVYNQKGVMGWKVKDVSMHLEGMEFTITNGQRTLLLSTRLIGKHLLGALSVCVALAVQLGLTDEDITEGVAETAPFEHRMQPYPLAGGWIIDDTYNGNLEGVRAGLAMLKELSADRKTYVTPGLVDQGKLSEQVHKQIGRLIAKAKPDAVVLMKNSVTKWIKAGLKDGDYDGKVSVQADPLEFYSNLDQFVAVGDVVLMQNDWTDNYA